MEKQKKAKLFSYLKTMRVNQVILEATDIKSGRHLKISITENGELYDIKGAFIDKTIAKRYWTKIFEFSQEYRYNIVPDNFYEEVKNDQ